MDEYKIGDLAEFLGSLIATSRDLHLADSLSRHMCNDAFCNNLSLVLEGVDILCERFEADPSLRAQITVLASGLKNKTADHREGVLCAQLDAIIKGIKNNLDSRKFMFIPADQASYWNNLELFGKNAIFAFPEAATFEMLEAGRCFAAGRGTACVFHCMRVAEYGLRKLAVKLLVTITHNGKKCPLEYGDWNKVIAAIRSKIAEIRRFPVGPTKEQSLQFYSNAVDHCEYMKDIWRNELAHTRRTYSKAETLGVISRVRDFIQQFPISEKYASKELEKRMQRRVRQLQQTDGKLAEDTAQRNQSKAGRGETGEKAEAGSADLF